MNSIKQKSLPRKVIKEAEENANIPVSAKTTNLRHDLVEYIMLN